MREPIIMKKRVTAARRRYLRLPKLQGLDGGG
jgi:hypothetical protein